jgi:hypothetical protein
MASEAIRCQNVRGADLITGGEQRSRIGRNPVSIARSFLHISRLCCNVFAAIAHTDGVPGFWYHCSANRGTPRAESAAATEAELSGSVLCTIARWRAPAASSCFRASESSVEHCGQTARPAGLAIAHGAHSMLIRVTRNHSPPIALDREYPAVA